MEKKSQMQEHHDNGLAQAHNGFGGDEFMAWQKEAKGEERASMA